MIDYAPTHSTGATSSWILRPTTLAGVGFSLVWIIGLSVFAASTTVVSSGAQVIAAYRGNELGGVLQYLFTEGLPPIAILIVVGALAQAIREAGHRRLALATWITAVVGSIISFFQFAIGFALVAVAVPVGNASSSAFLSDAVTRLDGVKMLLFASMAITALTYLVKAQGGTRLWLLVVSALLAVTIAISGVGYLLTMSSLANAAFVSLPLLLIWITGVGIVLGRSAH